MIVSFDLQEKWVCRLKTRQVIVTSSNNDYLQAFRAAIETLVAYDLEVIKRSKD